MRYEWDKYFMDLADMVATRSSCVRRKVGALLVKDRQILTTGYNGVPRGIPHCTLEAGEFQCIRGAMNIPSGTQHELCRGLHAEQNVIIQAALHGVNIAGSTLYVTHSPCIICTKMIINAGIRDVKYRGNYSDEMSLQMLELAGITHELLQIYL